MNEEQIKQYYERIEKLLNGASKETYGFAPEEIRQMLKCYEYLQKNWNKLKKWLEEENKRNINWYKTLEPHDKGYYLYKFGVTGDVLNNVQYKIQELEGKSE